MDEVNWIKNVEGREGGAALEEKIKLLKLGKGILFLRGNGANCSAAHIRTEKTMGHRLWITEKIDKPLSMDY
jgi:hypothetical protein